MAVSGPAFAQTGPLAITLNNFVVDTYSSSGGDPLEYGDGSSRLPNGHVDTTLTLGDAIQGGFYGNAANTNRTNNPDHGTLPSLSPGPQVNGSGGPGTGTTWGDIKKVFNPGKFELP